MKLSEYLSRPGQTASELAAKCDVSVSTITRAARLEMDPSLTLMGLIVEHTGGMVTPNDFLEAIAAKRRAPATDAKVAA